MGIYKIICPECGKVHLWFSGNTDQRCPECQAKNPTVKQEQKYRIMEHPIGCLQGWQCPVCGSVYSPFIHECPKCVNSFVKVTITDNTETLIIENKEND